MEFNITGLIELAIQYSESGYIVIEPKGKVIFINKVYQQFLGKRAEEIVGKHITEVLPNSKLPEIAKSAAPALGVWQKQGDDYLYGNRIPLFQDGKLVGVMGQMLFQKHDDVKKLLAELNSIQSRLELYQQELNVMWSSKHTFDSIIGRSKDILIAKRTAHKAAASSATVLINGETGVGKEVFAHAIHSGSGRVNKPFIKVNCAAIPADLLESELFGYDEGAFTGAKKRGKPGKFELANEGTLFLDEIGDMPLSMQAKLLRVLQEKEVERVGGVKPIKINVRIIAATNQMLEDLIRQGQFRADLYYRLNVIPITIPPLRERREDIPEFVAAALRQVSRQFRGTPKTIHSAAIEILCGYSWPGNVRELFNVIERMVNLAETDEIMISDLPLGIVDIRKKKEYGSPKSLQFILEETERDAIIQALQDTQGNKSKAAMLLGIHRVTLHEKLRKFLIVEDSKSFK